MASLLTCYKAAPLFVAPREMTYEHEQKGHKRHWNLDKRVTIPSTNKLINKLFNSQRKPYTKPNQTNPLNNQHV
jgi:hypothetical protein